MSIKFRYTYRFVITLSVVALLAIGLPSFATTEQSSNVSQNENENIDCGQRVENYDYQTWFGDSPWNQAICDLAPYNNDITQGKDYASRLFKYAKILPSLEKPGDEIKYGGNFDVSMGLGSDANDWSTAVYYADKNTTRKQIKLCGQDNCSPSNLDKAKCWDVTDIVCMAPDTAIPWDPSWRAPGSTDDYFLDDSTDGNVTIIDRDSGYVYDLSGVDRSNLKCIGGRELLYQLAGKQPENRLCVSSADILRDNTGKIANVYSYDQGVNSGRGVGLQKAAMLVTPEEVAKGEIRHALLQGVMNTMSGPACSEQQLAQNNPQIVGKTCGFAASPAAQFEWSAATDMSRRTPHNPNAQCQSANDIMYTSTGVTRGQYLTVDKMIPEGMRFRLTSSLEEIDAWLDRRAIEDPNYLPGKPKRETARTFAVALHDYGWIVGDTSCGGAGFITAGGANKEAQSQWHSLGVTSQDESKSLLDGLFTQTNILAVAAPTSKCVDGSTTKFNCKWLSAAYDSQDFSSPTVTTKPATPSNPVPVTAPVGTKPDSSSTTDLTVDVPNVEPDIEPVNNVTSPTALKYFELKYNWTMFAPCSWKTSCYVRLAWVDDPLATGGYSIERVTPKSTDVIKLKRGTPELHDFQIVPNQKTTYTITGLDSKGKAISKGITRSAEVKCVLMFCSL